MYERNALGISIMIPRTIIDAVKLKFHVRNKRKTGNSCELIEAQEEYQKLETRQNT